MQRIERAGASVPQAMQSGGSEALARAGAADVELRRSVASSQGPAARLAARMRAVPANPTGRRLRSLRL
jgi:hypothetical protein